MREGLFYDIMVDVDERPDGSKKELYDKLSFDFLIECAKNKRIDEWNQGYEEYLRSEWVRIFPDKEYDPEKIGKLFDRDSDIIRPDFTYRDFTNVIQDGANFIGAHLEGTDFTGAHLEDADFRGAHLEGTCFINGCLDEAKFLFAHLKGAHFYQVHIERATFFKADLSGANLSNATLIGTDFSEALIEKANFMYSNLEGAFFRNAHLQGSKFLEAHLKGTHFSHAHLENTEFNNADLTDANLSDAYLQDTEFYNAQLKGAIFNNSNLERANFNLARLDGADFLSSKLEDAVFYLARLDGARFNHSYIEGADFRYTMVRGTQFIEVIIDDKTDFTGTYLAEILIHPNLRKHLERNIRKLNITNKNVFVAMKFNSPDLDSALENAIKPACRKCGKLKAFTVNEKAGDGWIPQTIREGILNARFVISDLTYRNHGVYYETGYADGLEIPVIQTCKRSWYDKEIDPLHFDIAQRNTIRWDDDNDLKQQLIQKIKELQANGK
ncbi:MAG: pentapeptide repeat-containing protein [Methanocorpusculum sp.]|uniref:pentapeptide repeat-containing protein n=1 Tax=Methanocorpusculum sp. TaxID=2058474 RepID=UPI002727F5CE|nr:pentapeptide repeat-containing protein [Methanocorpusculum sp.]MDO9522279.1 pentapeptide repeat-containing protein [Methanocorpusculum sp.]